MINTNEKYPLPCEREHCRGYTVRILPCKPVLQIISAVLSLRWRAIIGLSEAAGRRRLHKTFIWNVTMSLHLKVFMVFLLQK